jgi:hypothetical protein
MENRQGFRKYLPYLIALLVFAGVSAVYFSPQYRGEVLRQGDMIQVSSMSKDIEDFRQEYGEDPQWAGRLFGGMPSYLIVFDYEGRLVREAMNPVSFFLGTPAGYLFLAMAGFFLMLLCFGVNPWIALTGGLAYGLSTYFPIIIGAGHLTKMVALGYAPPMIGGIWLAYRRNRWLGAALAGVFTSLEIGANHLQITYYFLFVILALILNEAVRAVRERALPRFLKTSALLLLAAGLAIGSNLIQLYYVYSYSKDTIRGDSELTPAPGTPNEGLDKAYATAWSYGRAETFDLFIPGVMGGSSSGGFSDDGPVARSLTPYNARNLADRLPGYWGDQSFTEGPVYIGAVVIFLAVLGMFLLRGRNKWWLLALTVLAILLAWGHNLMGFTNIFFDHVPFYNKFRTVSMILVIVEWTLPLLAALALQKVWKGDVPKEKFNKALKYSLILAGGTALVFALFGGSLFGFAGPHDGQMGLPDDVLAAMRLERAAMLRGDAWRTLLLVVLSAAALWALFRQKIRKGIFVVAISLLVLIDLIGVDSRFVNHDSFVAPAQAQIQPTAANLAIQQDTAPGYRVANLTVDTFQDATTSYFHRSVGGYHAAKLRRYQDLIDRHLSKMNTAVYDMLNTRYFIVPGEDGQPVPQFNPGAMGAAWLVPELAYVPGPDAEIAALDRFEPAQTAYVDKRFQDIAGERTRYPVDSTAFITLTDYQVNHLTYRYSAPAGQLAVFSEIYYPEGWTAFVDGVETPHFRADYVLRAMVLPAGEHTVEFRYRAPHFDTLVALTLVCSVLLLAGLVAVIVLAIVSKRRKF